MTEHQHTTSKGVWAIRIAGLALLAYTFAMTFLVPLGPGIQDVVVTQTELTDKGGVYEVEVIGHGTHFFETAPRVFLLRGKGALNATAVKSMDDTHLKCRIRLPAVIPSPSFDVYVNNEIDGTMSYANGFFASGLEVVSKATLPDDPGVLENLSASNLGFHFPFQPNIMESIRNPMLHVPMWFTMFLLMGISFAQSIRTLRLGGDPDRDLRAVASVKVGLWFGVLGLLTGSL